MSSNRLQMLQLRVFAPLLALALTATASSYGQTQVLATPRILDDVNAAQMVTVKGGAFPLAQARFDHGRLADSTPTGHMMMLLKRSDAQEQALQQLMAAQQDSKSPSYHKWLTPESFGAQFGVADADVQAVSSYLSSQGFTVGRVFKNKMAIEFSGTTGQVRSSFKTEIHNYVVNGQAFHANATAPQIPAALAPVVTGFAAMSNYKSPTQPQTQQMLLDRRTGGARPLYADQASVLESVSPGDLAAIYDIPTSTYTGTGVTVGVVSDSNINVAIPANYRTTFGLPANPPTVVVDGNDPGITVDAPISYAQIELVAATAPAAKVNLYTAASTQLGSGISFASIRALEDNTVQVLVFGYEGCEANLGQTNTFINAVWEQAAAQGISVIAGSGTGGSAACDANPASPEAKASQGLAVNGYASTPYDTAVGTSDFYYGKTGAIDPSTLNSYSQYWNTTNNGTAGYTSAKGYVPEQPNNASLQSTNQASPFSPEVFATGGGISTLGLTSDDGTQAPYPRPTYQMRVKGLNAGTARVIPDVSIFGGFNNGSIYITCVTASDCVGSSAHPDTLNYSAVFQSSGLAAATFGGIAALVVQAKGPQGNLNPALYATYAAAPTAFHDITAGTNTVQCSGGPNCVNGYVRAPAGGVMAYKAGANYDAASGLGSVDVANLISNWTSPTGVATMALAIAPAAFHHGDAAQLTVSVAGAGGTPTGDVAITTSSPQNTALETLTLVNGTATDSQIGALLPAGTYQVIARYAGDSKFASAVASRTITVYQVQSAMDVLSTDLQNKPLPLYNGQTFTYGSTVQFSFQVYSTTDKNDPGTPSGAITVYDNGNKAATVLLNSGGYATFTSSTLAPGSHSFSATYAGDSTYSSTSLTSGFPKLVIGGAPTQTVLGTTIAGSLRNSTFQLVATVTPTAAPQCNAPSCVDAGAAPGGTVRFTAGGSLLGSANLNLGMNTGTKPSSTAVFTVPRQALPVGTASVVATYIPDSTGNYTGSASAPFSVSVAGSGGGTYANTSIKVAAVPAGAVNFANSGTVGFKATVSVAAGVSVATGDVNFFANGGFIGGATLDNTGAASFVVSDPVGQLPLGQVSISAQYNGDSTHASSVTSYTINVYDGTSTPDFSMQSDPIYQTISASATTATFSLQFTSLNGLAAVGTPIALSYTTPRGFTCTGAPTAPNFNGGTSATVTLSCGPSAGSTVALMSKPNSPMLWMAEGGAALACVFLFGMPARRRSWQSIISSMALIVVAFGVTGCGVNGLSGKEVTGGGTLNGNSATPAVTITPGTYNVTVTGTARVFVKSQSDTTVTVVHNLPLKIVVN